MKRTILIVSFLLFGILFVNASVALPSAPTTPTVTSPSANTLKISWPLPANCPSCQYQVKRTNDNQYFYPGTATSITDSGLNCNTTYSYKVRGCANGDGSICGSWSAEGSGKPSCAVLGQPEPTTNPGLITLSQTCGLPGQAVTVTNVSAANPNGQNIYYKYWVSTNPSYFCNDQPANWLLLQNWSTQTKCLQSFTPTKEGYYMFVVWAATAEEFPPLANSNPPANWDSNIRPAMIGMFYEVKSGINYGITGIQITDAQTEARISIKFAGSPPADLQYKGWVNLNSYCGGMPVNWKLLAGDDNWHSDSSFVFNPDDFDGEGIYTLIIWVKEAGESLVGSCVKMAGGTYRYKKLVAVVVNENIAPQIQSELNQYESDLQSEGYRVEIENFSPDRSVDELRNLLKSKLAKGLIGAELIGDLPIPLFDESASYSYEDPDAIYPNDQIYSDLDGEWLDQNGDGIYDYHNNIWHSAEGPINNSREIWVGRLTFSTMEKGEILCLKEYFAKNHQWRRNWPYQNQKALAYLDEGYEYYTGDPNNPIDEQRRQRLIELGDTTVSFLKEVYPEVDLVNDPIQTTAEDFKTRLGEDYEIVHVIAHGGSDAQMFYLPNDCLRLDNTEILELQPQARFYDLASCGVDDYRKKNYMAGCYLASGQGLAVFGGASFPVSQTWQCPFNFCYGLAQGKSIGEALKEDLRTGAYIFGDPSLRIINRELFPVVPFGIPTGVRTDNCGKITWNDGTTTFLVYLFWDKMGDNYLHIIERICQETGQKYLFSPGSKFGEAPQWFSDTYNLQEGNTYIYRVRSLWKDENGWQYSQWSEPIEVIARLP